MNSSCKIDKSNTLDTTKAKNVRLTKRDSKAG